MSVRVMLDIDGVLADMTAFAHLLAEPPQRWQEFFNHVGDAALTQTNASWADPIEAQFGPLRTFTMTNSNYPNHTALARALRAYLRWRNLNNRHPDVIAAQRRERARIRSEHHHRWGRPAETQTA